MAEYLKKLKKLNLVLAGRIWLGDNSSSEADNRAAYSNPAPAEKRPVRILRQVGGALIPATKTASNMRDEYTLFAAAYRLYNSTGGRRGWIGEAGPGASYGDKEEAAPLLVRTMILLSATRLS